MNAQQANNIEDTVRRLQVKLYLSAKGSKTRRFHTLYDKIYREDILERAWKEVRENAGSAGIDNETIDAIENSGIEKTLSEMALTLKEERYKPLPARRVEIPKENGKKRPLGIPAVKDRIIQAATKIVMEPIFESDFKQCSYGFRPKRSAHNALEAIRKTVDEKMGIVILDADITAYFDTINHDKLMKLVEMRVSDRRVLKLIRQWLKCGIIKDGIFYDSEVGSPQGSVISPLLANIYLNYFDTVWEKHCSSIGTLVRYCDDFVIICRRVNDARDAYEIAGKIMQRLELTLNADKTRIINLWNGKEGFDFLGYYHRKIKQHYADGTGYYYKLQRWLSSKARRKIRQKVKECLGRNTTSCNICDRIKAINRKITGWRNYYGLSRWDKLKQIDEYINLRMVLWINKKRKQPRMKDCIMLIRFVEHMGLMTLASHSAS